MAREWVQLAARLKSLSLKPHPEAPRTFAECVLAALKDKRKIYLIAVSGQILPAAISAPATMNPLTCSPGSGFRRKTG
jgi:hypothetical protein